MYFAKKTIQIVSGSAAVRAIQKIQITVLPMAQKNLTVLALQATSRIQVVNADMIRFCSYSTSSSLPSAALLSLQLANIFSNI